MRGNGGKCCNELGPLLRIDVLHWQLLFLIGNCFRPCKSRGLMFVYCLLIYLGTLHVKQYAEGLGRVSKAGRQTVS